MLCSELIFILHYYSKETRKSLYTCAIRPAAIYGPGEERHFPRIIKFAKLGLIPFKIGSTNVKTDWVYVDNLVLALLLASIGLLDDIPGQEGPPVAAGQAYFISDGNWSLAYIFFVYTLKIRLIVSIVYCFYSRDLFETSNLQNACQHTLNLSNSYLHYLTLFLYFLFAGSPINSFEFLCPLLKSLDYELPTISLAVPQALLLGNFFWALYSIMYPWLSCRWLPQPFILPAEVYKVCV